MSEKRRQPLTQARKAGPIRAWGQAGLGEAMAAALRVANEDPRILTHGFHPYAARMHPITARRVLAALELPKGARLFDPFCGSGTVLVEGLRAGLATTGVDLSPLATLIAHARTWAATPAQLRELVERARAIRDAVLEEGKAARRGEDSPLRKVTVTQRKVLAGAFQPHVRREIESLAMAVEAETDEGGDILRAILSSIVVKMSKRGGEERALGRGMAARLFADRAVELAAGLDRLWREAPPETPSPEIVLADARVYRWQRKFDAVVTSPPYPGTYDYADQHELPLALLGKLSPHLRKDELGSRRSLMADVEAGLRRWEDEFVEILVKLAGAVKEGGRIVLLMGDSTAGKPPRTRAVYLEETLTRLAPRAGLRLVAGADAERDKVGPTEARVFGDRPKLEHLVVLSAVEKPKDPKPPAQRP